MKAEAGQRVIGVAVVGAGYFGSGLLRRLTLLHGFDARLLANRTPEHGYEAYARAGVRPDQIVLSNNRSEVQRALDSGRYVITTDLLLPTSIAGVDVIAEATGNLLVGTEVALAALSERKHLVAANSDVQATVGAILQCRADAAGVVYTDIDGDEPGLLTQLYRSCISMGLEVVVAGNCKGVLKRYATPETQAAYAAEYGLQPWLATAAADGTKLNLELTVTANATGLVPAVHGMCGPAVDMGELIASYDRLGVLDGHHVDYQLGGRGVFAIVRSNDPFVQSDFRYVKMGDGPYYLFHDQRVLIHYAAPDSIRQAALRGASTVAPCGAPVAETIGFAKRDLSVGQRIDGIGGFDSYGMIVRADEAVRDRLVPIGLAQYTVVTRPIKKDEPIGYESVEFVADNLACKLRREQDTLFASSANAAPTA